MDNLDRGLGDAQLVRHDLGEHRLMALPVAVRANHHADVAGRIHPHRGRVIKTNPCAKDADKVARRNAAGLDPG